MSPGWNTTVISTGVDHVTSGKKNAVVHLPQVYSYELISYIIIEIKIYPDMPPGWGRTGERLQTTLLHYCFRRQDQMTCIMARVLLSLCAAAFAGCYGTQVTTGTVRVELL